MYQFHNRMPVFDADDGASGGGGEPAPETGAEEAKDAPDNADKPQSLKDALKANPEWQKDLDRRINDAVQKATASERDRQKVIQDDLVEETMRVAKMTDSERETYYAEKAKKQAAERERDITRRELMLDARIALQDRHLPSDFVDLLNLTDAASMQASIDTLEKAFTAAVQGAVAERMKGGKPIPDAGTEGMKEGPEDAQAAALAAAMEAAGIRHK